MTDVFENAAETVNMTNGGAYIWRLSFAFTKVNSSSNGNYDPADPGLRFCQGDILTSDAGDRVITRMEFSA